MTLLTATHQPLLSKGTGLGLDNNTLNKTSVTGDDVDDHTNDDEGLAFGDFEQDANVVACVYLGVHQRNIVPTNDTLLAKVELLHLIKKHKLHMKIVIRILDWVVKSQSQIGLDFSLTQHYTRSTILKDIQSHFCFSQNPNNSET